MRIEPAPEAPEAWNALADELLREFGDQAAGQGQPVWAQMVPLPQDGRDMLGIALSDHDPGLLGWTAPESCRALVMVATGRVHVEDGPSDRPPGLQPGVTAGARLACIVARDGSVGWSLQIPGAEVPADPPEEGRLLDTMKRCFGLPTPPPSEGCGALRAAIWIGSIIDVSAISPDRLSWSQVSELMPRVQPGRPGPALSTVDEMLAFMEQEPPTWTWEDLRVSAVRSGWSDPVVSASIAAWMDEGMFSRWILDAMPSTDDLLASVRPALSPVAARRLAHAVRSAA